MKKVIAYPLISAFIVLLSLSGCKKDDEGVVPCSAAWVTDLESELSALYTAAAAYGTDPSLENCTAYKSAYQDYIDALKPYGNCATLTGTDREEWQQALDEAEAEVETLCEE
jgi:hypothetical protein